MKASGVGVDPLRLTSDRSSVGASLSGFPTPASAPVKAGWSGSAGPEGPEGFRG